MPGPTRLNPPCRHGPAPTRRGTHRIFIGMAAGVGKTYRALHELRERLERGEDALIGLLETHGRRETLEAAKGLPVFPRREVQHGNVTLGELDVEGLLRRRPQVVLVDELAHTNAPGSPRAKRWQDVEALLDAGIDVLSTMNVQHLESLNDTVARLTGVRVRERVPDHVLHDADELVLIDLPPEDLRERLRAGKIYGPDKIEQALGNFFTVPNLTALREIALRHVAQAVELEVPEGQPAAHEVIVVAVAAEGTAARLIRRGGQLAERLHGELHVVSVRSARLTQEQSRLLDTCREITQALGGTFELLENTGGVGPTLVAYARRVNATQIVLGETSRSRWAELLRGDIIKDVLRQTQGVDVYVISRD
ncbi:potassium-transporting ATPase, D subunit (plasmid) [Deinococcus geothermalis DSM 11300]|uniref:Potassium-transporting ATPase, D subunit n=1 Tax=Deinococcus geothermalis (strain DSM 11300 / CIP 105573 / AG-3a) TaxID=319795 RepID=Q1J2K3_DEIGD|nr:MULTISPECIES: universal stress protein [Deinococcus]ABF44281.1 potassium-transporting ATPase, D subunit [Deinococcus geothermalis DSM 11300]TDE85615.1 sensor histidine kinase KdpD [Deinococcus sp. S9]